ncbi:MAG: hypothetical protein P8Y91_06520 [Desulfuromonadales bacterium]
MQINPLVAKVWLVVFFVSGWSFHSNAQQLTAPASDYSESTSYPVTPNNDMIYYFCTQQGQQIAELQVRLADRGLNLTLTPAARTFVAKAAYDPVYGARPLKRYLQHHLETKIGRAMIASEVVEGSRITVDVVDDALDIRFDAP